MTKKAMCDSGEIDANGVQVSCAHGRCRLFVPSSEIVTRTLHICASCGGFSSSICVFHGKRAQATAGKSSRVLVRGDREMNFNCCMCSLSSRSSMGIPFVICRTYERLELLLDRVARAVEPSAGIFGSALTPSSVGLHTHVRSIICRNQ